VTDQGSIESAAANVLEAFGGLDIIINNAGYLEYFLPIADSDTSEWWRTWDMNLRSIYLCTKFFLPILLKGGEKTIINIGSIGAHHFMPGVSFSRREG
jgi:NAD(P)-dependent dehydrogenase (short-subunit alcohol dehydrogenase family)